MIAINTAQGWAEVTLQGGVTEALAMQLLSAMDYETLQLPEENKELLQAGERKLTEICHLRYVHGEFFNEAYMEWVSVNESTTMLLFGGHIILTSHTVERDDERGTFKDIVRWFQHTQFTLTHEDI